MKLNIIRRISALLTVVLLCLAMPLFTASAIQSKDISIPIRISVNGKNPEAQEPFIIRLTADKSTFPMPNGKLGGSFEIKLKGEGEAEFSPISYDTVGEYTYILEQIAGDNPNFIYDSRKYRVKVTISNNDSSGYDATIVMHEEGKDTKPDSAKFTNSYDSSVSNTDHSEGLSQSERHTDSSTVKHTQKHTQRYTQSYTQRHTESGDISGATDSEATTKPSSSTPETGVNSRIFLWCFLLIASGFGMIGTAFGGKKKARENQK